MIKLYVIMTSFDSTFCFLLFMRADFSGQRAKPSLMSTSGPGMTSSSLSSGSRTRVKLSNETWACWGSASGLGVTSECCRLTCSDNDTVIMIIITMLLKLAPEQTNNVSNNVTQVDTWRIFTVQEKVWMT